MLNFFWFLQTPTDERETQIFHRANQAALKAAWVAFFVLGAVLILTPQALLALTFQQLGLLIWTIGLVSTFCGSWVLADESLEGDESLPWSVQGEFLESAGIFLLVCVAALSSSFALLTGFALVLGAISTLIRIRVWEQRPPGMHSLPWEFVSALFCFGFWVTARMGWARPRKRWIAVVLAQLTCLFVIFGLLAGYLFSTHELRCEQALDGSGKACALKPRWD